MDTKIVLLLNLILFLSVSLYSQNVFERNIINEQGYDITFTAGARKVNVMIPMGSMGDDVTLRCSLDPVNEGLLVSRDVLNNAAQSLPNTNSFFEEYVFEIRIFDGPTPQENTFIIPIKIEIYYRDNDQDGFIDGSHPLIFEEKASAYVLAADSSWRIFEDQERDVSLNAVTLYISGPGTYAVIGEVNYSPDTEHVQVYPNPFKPGSHGSFDAAGITFNKVTTDAEITIYNLTGEVIRVLRETDTDGMVLWDAKNAHGVDTVSGIYLAHIQGQNDKKIYKVAIER